MEHHSRLSDVMVSLGVMSAPISGWLDLLHTGLSWIALILGIIVGIHTLRKR